MRKARQFLTDLESPFSTVQRKVVILIRTLKKTSEFRNKFYIATQLLTLQGLLLPKENQFKLCYREVLLIWRENEEVMI